MSTARIRAIIRKELREYRHNRQIVITMSVLPLVFSVFPILQFFAASASAANDLARQQPLIYMLALPAIVPGTVAAYSVAGERQQGTLEPLLSTPLRAEEFLLGKAIAALIPSLLVSYGVFGVFVVALEFLAQPAVASAVLQGPEVLAQLLFTPPVAALSIWMSTAISARSSDTRVATQLSTLASVPTVVVTTAIAVGGINPTHRLIVLLTVVLLALDGLGWRLVPPLFNRERLITGTHS